MGSAAADATPSIPPLAALLPELDLRRAADRERLLGSGPFPLVRRGSFVFAFADPSGVTRRVWLRHGLTGHRRPPAFRRGPHGLHVLAFAAQDVRRFEYELELERDGGRRETIVDPLNPYVVDAPFGPRSVAHGPGAAAPTLARPVPDARAGMLEDLEVPGYRGRPARAWLWRPAGDDGARPLPLVTFLDGGDYLRFARVPRLLANAIDEGLLRRCRALLLPPRDRSREYSGSPTVARLLTREIPEALARHVPLPAAASERVGVGASLGGFALLHAQLVHPGWFGGLVLQSGSFFRPDTDADERGFAHFARIAACVARLDAPGGRGPGVPIRLTCGRGEENLANNRRLAAALAARGTPVTLAETGDAHNWTSWRDALAGEIRRGRLLR